MKITLSELKQIIRQEVKNARRLNEEDEKVNVLKETLKDRIESLTDLDSVEEKVTEIMNELFPKLSVTIEESMDMDNETYNGVDRDGEPIGYVGRSYDVEYDEEEGFLQFFKFEFYENKKKIENVEISESTLEGLLEANNKLSESKFRRRNPRRFY